MFKSKAKKLTWEQKKALANSEHFKQVCAGMVSRDYLERSKYNRIFAETLGPVIREGIMDGSNITDIFSPDPVEAGSRLEYPLHFLSPGTEKDYVAYTMSRTGDMPTRLVQGDRIYLTTYWVANSIELDLAYIRDASWTVTSAALDLLEAGVVKKLNDDGWHTLLGAGLDRGILVFDSGSTDGQFSRRLISLMKIAMIRNGGGNMGSIGRANLTDLYVSHEALEDIRNWDSTEADDFTRNEFANDPDGKVASIYGINLHPMDELGVGQEYQSYWASTLSGTMNGSDEEIVVGLDLGRAMPTFVHPVRQDFDVFPDESAFALNKQRWFTRGEVGFGVLDSRGVIIGSF